MIMSWFQQGELFSNKVSRKARIVLWWRSMNLYKTFGFKSWFCHSPLVPRAIWVGFHCPLKHILNKRWIHQYLGLGRLHYIYPIFIISPIIFIFYPEELCYGKYWNLSFWNQIKAEIIPSQVKQPGCTYLLLRKYRGYGRAYIRGKLPFSDFPFLPLLC